MLSSQMTLVALLAIPTLILVVLRINAAMVFLSLCLGAVLVQYVAGEANSLITLFTPGANTLSASTIQIGLLLIPAVITSVVTVFSIKNKLKGLLNILPAAASSAFAVLIAVPLLPGGTPADLQVQPLWDQLVKSQALVVGVGAIVSLAFLWFQRQHSKGTKGKSKH